MEKIKCVFEINKEVNPHRPKMNFYVVIPCDKEGNVLEWGYLNKEKKYNKKIIIYFT